MPILNLAAGALAMLHGRTALEAAGPADLESAGTRGGVIAKRPTTAFDR